MAGSNDDPATPIIADDENSAESSPPSPSSDNALSLKKLDLPVTSSGAGGGKKRKIQYQPINLLQFVEMIWHAFESTVMETNDETNSKRLIVPNRILKYLNATDSTTEESTMELKSKNKSGVLLRLVLQAFREIEAAGMTVQFSRETLKCFLATYSSFVTPSDFVHTNVLVKNEKRNKNSSPLPPGGILLEYVKGLEMFASNMSRADKNDVKALRLIMERDIRLPYNIYYDVRNVKFVDTVYETEKSQQQHQQQQREYVKIQASNFKRAVVLLTNSVILVWDGHQFVVPSVSIEKDIPTSALLKNRDEYALFDMMISTKNKVLDLMETNVSDLVIPDNYAKRLKLIGERFPDLKCVTLNTREHVDSSYVRKPLTGDRLSAPSYVYTKPNLTGAIVGSMDKHVLVAFRDDTDNTVEYYDDDDNNNSTEDDNCINDALDGSLIVKTKCNIAGPTMYMITSAAQQAKLSTTSNNNVVRLGNKRYRVSLPSDDSTTATTTATTTPPPTSNYHHRLFSEAIPVEIKDGNKLGNLSSYDVSHVREYKPPALPKDAAIFDSFNHILNNPDNFVRLLSQSPSFGKIVAMLRKTDQHQEVGNIDFGNYNV